MKRLNLNRELLWSVFDSLKITENYEVQIEKNSKQPSLSTVKLIDNSNSRKQCKAATINVYENNDGSTTIDFDRGQNKELSKSIAILAVDYAITRNDSY